MKTRINFFAELPGFKPIKTCVSSDNKYQVSINHQCFAVYNLQEKKQILFATAHSQLFENAYIEDVEIDNEAKQFTLTISDLRTRKDVYDLATGELRNSKEMAKQPLTVS